MVGCKIQESKKAKTFHKLHVLRVHDDLRDRVRGLGRETWRGSGTSQGIREKVFGFLGTISAKELKNCAKYRLQQSHCKDFTCSKSGRGSSSFLQAMHSYVQSNEVKL